MTAASAGTTPYYSYNDSEWSTELASPDTFVPDLVKTGEEIGVGHLKEPTDLCIDRLGQVYVLDKTGGRVLVLDGELELVTIIDRFTLDGAEYLLKEPEGLFVAQDGMLYIADTGNGRALRVTPEGEITQTYEKPETEAYTADGFAPIKLAADGDGMVYIVPAAGYYSDYYDAIKQTLQPMKIIEPDLKLNAYLRERYAEFLEINEKLAK